MFQGYVINLDRRTDRLSQFYQQQEAHSFQRVAAVDKEFLALIGDGREVFNTAFFCQSIQRPITLGEIGCTLSHIKTWRLIAENNQLADDDFAIVAEDDVKLIANFSQYLTACLAHFKSTQADIVLLQKLELAKGGNVALFSGGDLNYFVPKSAVECDNYGSSLYLIRKSKAVSLLKRLEAEKPAWLADQFSLFCELDKMIILSQLFGYVPPETESDLENERNLARQQPHK
ncbi:glycosyltransferase family 25 protein [Muribacter muris]|uniref:Glycosyltransferase family 25 protein n=1 Tax=Muribacter muris TaxID=67855 RepID=A0A4Y9JZZ8_9PAST|nr:glycosyltransferase family 25 protein [Muribacter muris]MBF0785228.1 glycosyltransferase family 25 protein [Muribacter muris]MBF0828410.1 glycosyltransferase family 25 protein [Muribacter muris]TFV10055.1 glycosyltransferase family 25 protein [Muribacter muris]